MLSGLCLLLLKRVPLRSNAVGTTYCPGPTLGAFMLTIPGRSALPKEVPRSDCCVELTCLPRLEDPWYRAGPGDRCLELLRIRLPNEYLRFLSMRGTTYWPGPGLLAASFVSIMEPNFSRPRREQAGALMNLDMGTVPMVEMVL